MSCLQTFDVTNGSSGLVPPSAVLLNLSELLDGLKARVAEEFMALAAALQVNSLHVREITAASHKATGSETVQRSSHSIAVLQGVLADSASVTEMVATSTVKMSEILVHMNRVQAPLGRLTKMSTLLRIVSVLSRIESGRIDSCLVDISGLSHDIDSLAADVERHIDEILLDASILSGLLRNGVGELDRFGEQERVGANDLITRTQALLSPALTRAEASQVAARTIDEQYQSFHRATDKVVMSLQSEDLSRQRVEHVQEALRSVAARLDAGDSAQSCASILILQRAQLVGTRDLLAGSVQTIHAALLSLGPQIQELVSKTTILAHQTDEDGRSFATLIDSEFDTVAGVFQRCSSSASSVVSIVNSVLPSVEKMTGHACALEAIEVSIHLISLNATVKTSQLGSEGAAMGVLASELQTITAERGGDTVQVLTDLAAIREALAKITQGRTITEGSSIMINGGGDRISGELAALSLAVTSESHNMVLRLEEVRHLAEAICSDLTSGAELAVRTASLTERFDDLLGGFDQAFARLGLSGGIPAADPGIHYAEHLSNLYSMESERVLHHQTFGVEAPGYSAITPCPADVSEFGDDVELF
jgi:hypothetical protein